MKTAVAQDRRHVQMYSRLQMLIACFPYVSRAAGVNTILFRD